MRSTSNPYIDVTVKELGGFKRSIGSRNARATVIHVPTRIFVSAITHVQPMRETVAGHEDEELGATTHTIITYNLDVEMVVEGTYEEVLAKIDAALGIEAETGGGTNAGVR